MSKIRSFSVKSVSDIENKTTEIHQRAKNVLDIINRERSGISSYLVDYSFITPQDTTPLRDSLEVENYAMAEARNLEDYLRYAFHAYKQMEIVFDRMIERLKDSGSLTIIWNFLQARKKQRNSKYAPMPIPLRNRDIYEGDMIEIFFIKTQDPKFPNTLDAYLVTVATNKLRNLHGHPDLRDLTKIIDDDITWAPLNSLIKKVIQTQDYGTIHDNLIAVLQKAYQI